MSSEYILGNKDICIKYITFGLPKCEDDKFHAHIIIERKRFTSSITLKLFESGTKLRLDILAYNLVHFEFIDDITIKSKDINNDEIDSIVIPSSSIFTFQSSSDFYENGQQYVLLFLNEVFIYSKKDLDNNPPLKQESYFHLSNHASFLFDNYNHKSNNIGTWSANPHQPDFSVFRGIEYKLIMLFQPRKAFQKGDDELVIIKHPVVQLKYQIGHMNFHWAANFIKLLSFYLKEDIDYHYGFYYTADNTIDHYKSLSSIPFRKKATRCLHSKFESIYDFIDRVDVPLFPIKNCDFLLQIIDNFIASNYLKEESKFMVFFSILEAVRNNSVSENGVSTKEKFNIKSEALRKALIKLSVDMNESERSLFLESIDGKISNIKYLPVKIQFNSFFESISIDRKRASNYLSLNPGSNSSNLFTGCSFICSNVS